MRKKSIAYFSDTFMWYLIYLFPLLIFLFALKGSDIETVATYFSTNLYPVFSNNVIFTSLNQIFGNDPTAILPLFTGKWIFMIYYGTYFISCMLLHLCIDFLAFIPRLSHHWLDKMTKSDD